MARNVARGNGLRKVCLFFAEGFNQLSEDKFKVLGQSMTYQEVFKDYDLEEPVRSFYSL